MGGALLLTVIYDSRSLATIQLKYGWIRGTLVPQLIIYSVSCTAELIAMKVAQSHSVGRGLSSVRKVLCLTTIPVAKIYSVGGE